MIQAVFFDIDGTLIDTSTHQIPKSTILALQKLRQRGYKVGIASGRDIQNMRQIDGLDLSLFDGFVTSNGMCMFDAAENCIRFHAYPEDSIKKILAFAKQRDMTLIFQSMEEIYTANAVNRFVDIANLYYQETTPLYKQWQGEKIIKISCFQDFDFDFSEIAAQVNIHFIATPTTTYDLTLASVSKLSGIHEMMEHWNLPPSAFMCFGDHDNDIEMLQGAQLGVAVKDALGSKRVQQLADDVCPAAKDDGIYQYLKEKKMID